MKTIRDYLDSPAKDFYQAILDHPEIGPKVGPDDKAVTGSYTPPADEHAAHFAKAYLGRIVIVIVPRVGNFLAVTIRYQGDQPQSIEHEEQPRIQDFVCLEINEKSIVLANVRSAA